ncbi:aminocarboxymuconate-semialdehyde decarboxylase [Amycolatopsis keratiniphila]|uniref:Aminocarboxymuconate-semialdehyde decarboxylase n=1 Tax=Amycolatopsis keratiniphila TaxID=129921 RepID=R4T070_9PSEU|nr:aminocarboxymuconate-semialdehyde decarboxylase [Amycolatopsis keratiniphila]
MVDAVGIPGRPGDPQRGSLAGNRIGRRIGRRGNGRREQEKGAEKYEESSHCSPPEKQTRLPASSRLAALVKRGFLPWCASTESCSVVLSGAGGRLRSAVRPQTAPRSTAPICRVAFSTPHCPQWMSRGRSAVPAETHPPILALVLDRIDASLKICFARERRHRNLGVSAVELSRPVPRRFGGLRRAVMVGSGCPCPFGEVVRKSGCAVPMCCTAGTPTTWPPCGVRVRQPSNRAASDDSDLRR